MFSLPLKASGLPLRVSRPPLGPRLVLSWMTLRVYVYVYVFMCTYLCVCVRMCMCEYVYMSTSSIILASGDMCSWVCACGGGGGRTVYKYAH